MTSLVAFYRSTVGKKILMAVSGLIGVGFVVGHMAGNLQAFLGAEKFNDYAALLQGPLKEFVWLTRIVLIAAVIVHVLMAFQLSARSRAARPVGYRRQVSQASTIASKTMLAGGLLLLAFIPLHILHFTTGQIDPAGAFHAQDAAGRHDVYANIVASFRVWWVTAFYLLAMLALGAHLFHGAWSSVRTLGVARPSPHPLRRKVAAGLAAAVWLGFTLVPLAVFVGVLR